MYVIVCKCIVRVRLSRISVVNNVYFCLIVNNLSIIVILNHCTGY